MTSVLHEDHISFLPNHLLAEIINRLPYLEAVRTTILSKRWHKIWRRELSDLDLSGMTLNNEWYIKFLEPFFYRKFWQPPFLRSCVLCHPGSSWDSSLSELVNELRSRGLRSLTMKSHDRYGVLRCDLLLMIRTLTDLCLKQWAINNTKLLHGSIALTRLCLRKCSLLIVSNLVDLLKPVSRNLKSLTISRCERFQLSNESWNNLAVANSGVLLFIGPFDIRRTDTEPLHIVELDITVTPHLKHLKIKQPHLQSLTINNPELETFFLEAPLLSLQTPPTIKLHSKLRSLVLRAPVKLLHNVANTYNNNNNNNLSETTEDPPFMCLRRLEVEVDLGGIMDSIYFCDVLRMCLVLRELVVCVKDQETDQGRPKAGSEYFWDDQDDLDCVQHTLTRVEVRGCKGSRLEEGFVLGLVGRKAKVLKTLVVSCKSEFQFVDKWRNALSDYKASSELDDIRFTVVL